MFDGNGGRFDTALLRRRRYRRVSYRDWVFSPCDCADWGKDYEIAPLGILPWEWSLLASCQLLWVFRYAESP